MSRQADAKKQQGYTKATPQCGRCEHFRSHIEKRAGYGDYTFESDLHCNIGKFKVNKTAWCEKFKRAEVKA